MERALILAPFDQGELGRLARMVDVIYESWLDTKTIQDPEELGRRLQNQNISILVVESDFVFEETFELAPCLKFVGICRGATNQIDVCAATRSGVSVVNTPGRNAQAVAEHVLGQMFALSRKIPKADQYVKTGRWQNPVEPYLTMRGVELAGRTLGIIGLGAIGGKLSSMTLAIGMNVIAHDPFLRKAPSDIELLALDELMARSDYVSTSVPLTADTEGMIGEREIGLMKPTAYLVNATDASVVQQDAILDALRNDRIAGAAFDVFQTHPIAPDNALLKLDNVILTPHIGGATDETIARHSKMIVDDIERFLKGERPLNLVNPDALNKHA